jgi:hypothetical protein
MNQRILDTGHTLYINWKTHCYYHPPANLKSLMKYAFRNGFLNAKSLVKYTSAMRTLHKPAGLTPGKNVEIHLPGYAREKNCMKSC